MRHWLILFLLALPCLAGAVSFNEQVERLPLGQSIDVFEDVRGSADINDITSRAIDSSFRRHDKDVLNAGYSRSVFWLRLDLDYRPVASSDPRTWLLELAYPPLDKLDLYLPDGQGGYRLAQRTGDTLPFASRPIRQNNYLFELGLEPNKPQRVYLRLEKPGIDPGAVDPVVAQGLPGGAARTHLCARHHLWRAAGDADLQPVHLPQRPRYQLSLLHPLYRFLRALPGLGERRRHRVLLARQPLVGERRHAIPDRFGGAVRLPVRAQLPAYPRPQRVGRPRPAGADGGRRAGHADGADHELRRGSTPGHLPGAGLHRPDLRRRHPRLAARHARGALFHHRLDRLPSRRHRQYPDGPRLPAEHVPHHVCQPDRFSAGGGLAVAGAGRPDQRDEGGARESSRSPAASWKR